MITVAFVLDLSNNWLGGVNYYRNLLTAISRYASDSIRVKVFLPKGKKVEDFHNLSKNVEFIHCSLATRWSPSWFVRKVWMKIFHQDMFLAQYLRHHGVDVFSHADLAVQYPNYQDRKSVV